MQISILGVDIGKNSFSVVGVDGQGAVILRRTMRRQTLIDFVEKLPRCVIAMEARCGAHHLGRLFAAAGHEVRLMSPEYVRPYVKAQKNDDRDAEGIAEAASRPTMRFVDLKSQEQLDIQTLHRVRSRLVAERTTLINQLRAILLERGVVFPAGRVKFESALDDLIAGGNDVLSPRIRSLIMELRDEWRRLDQKIETLNTEFVALAKHNSAMRRLTSIPGIGVLNATALVAAIGDASSFQHARDLGAWLGLVPRQFTTGGKARLLGITKRGNTYLRTLLVHGARAARSSADGVRGFKAEAGRYHLYVSLACPWAHRTLIIRNLKGLSNLVGVSVVHWLMLENGWTFEPGPGVVPDDINGVAMLHELYTLADPQCSSRVTVPVLWDKQQQTIVSNESSEILRMFNSAFDHLGATEGDYYPDRLRIEIDAVNDRIYDTVNNGVYKAGFASTQDAYEREVTAIFETLDWLEERLANKHYLVGDQLTEADIRLLPTLLRFDSVYFGHFKCNLRALVDYPALWAYTRSLYQHPDIRPTVDFQHIKGHYYGSHANLNPSGIVPMGPKRDFTGDI
ncbi:glutathionyl-hydroquinone reductase [Rhizobium sp. PP-F2F-G36]|nr:glutathionyl-hydroquinone reductase [Rhizobium sp. PP-F2F-G36]